MKLDPYFLVILLGCISSPIGCNQSLAQVRIILRNLDTIESPEVTIHDEFLELPKNRIFTWDRVFAANGLRPNQQSKFETIVQELGTPLYRIRHRLNIKDYFALADVAEPLFKKYMNRAANKSDAYNHMLVCLGCCRGRLARGHRASALVPFLRLCELSRKFPETRLELTTGNYTSTELTQSFTDGLVPIWFDKRRAHQALAQIEVSQNELRSQVDGVLIYLASLWAFNGNESKAKLAIDELENRSTELVQKWLPIVLAQIGNEGNSTSSNKLRLGYRSMSGAPRAVANFLVATQRTSNQDDNDQAILDLLYIPANFADQLPSLSAAALHLAANISEASGGPNEAAALRTELREKFPDTFHGRKTQFE